jgi:UDP-N-acetylmuramoyl-tripeptide--D-alanyl-D-alanine ligase
MKLTARDLRALDPVEFRDADLLQEAITGVSTDSRSLCRGDLFVALRGPTFDGHKYLNEIAARGARAAVVEASATLPGQTSLPLIVVEDTTQALGALGRHYRKKFSIPVLAIGGSSGKTTTKDMVAAVLGSRWNVLRTEKNFNNHIGVPKTIFGLERKHEIAVVEVGTNHPGELQTLCDILLPTHGLLTNIGAEHLEFFGSVDGVAREEGVLFEFLARSGGTAFVNADDRNVVHAAKKVRQRILYGFSSRSARIRGTDVKLDSFGRARFAFRGGRLHKRRTVQLGIPGRHQTENALAAAAVGLTFGVPAGGIVDSLASFIATEKRMAVLDLNGVTVLNDTYNANPDSTIAALETLASMKVAGKKVAVLGDMLELGASEQEEHRRVGRAAASLGIDYVLTVGSRAQHINEAVKRGFTLHYDQKNVLAEFLAELLTPGDAVLLKGSRGMVMEDIVTFLAERLHGPVKQKA